MFLRIIQYSPKKGLESICAFREELESCILLCHWVLDDSASLLHVVTPATTAQPKLSASSLEGNACY